MFTFEGYLPYFLLYTGAAAVIHSVVCYTGSSLTAMKLFSGPAAPRDKDLLARTYGLKNVYSGLIRFAAAFNTDNGVLYNLAMCTFVGVLLFTSNELFVHKSMRAKESWFSFVTAGSALVWMYVQRDFYVVS